MKLCDGHMTEIYIYMNGPWKKGQVFLTQPYRM